ncbi:hypothetical protein GW796_05995 [archaeon]|nr:hypothetical protein [archaeon]NCQ51436.1 hypothetical protein [archaeon]NCT58738.1 hypothetical protein [archaeon]
MKLNPEKLYNFKYTPKGLGKLEEYDKNPLIFVLDIQEPYLLAVNVHWIPKNHKFKFLEDLQEIMGKTIGRGKKRQRFKLVYTMLKKRPYKAGILAVRKYIIKNITGIKEVPQEKWNYVLGIDRYTADIRRKSNMYKKKKGPSFLK